MTARRSWFTSHHHSVASLGPGWHQTTEFSKPWAVCVF